MAKQMIVVHENGKERVLTLLYIDEERYVAVGLNDKGEEETHPLEFVSLDPTGRTLEQFFFAIMLYTILFALLIPYM